MDYSPSSAWRGGGGVGGGFCGARQADHALWAARILLLSAISSIASGLLLHVGEDVRVGVEGLRGVRERRIHRAVVSPSRQVTRVPL